MERKKLFLSVLPLAFLAESLAGCSSVPNIADYLELQCSANPQSEIASHRIELTPGQEISVGNYLFIVTDRGRLRFSTGDYKVEADDKGLIVGKTVSDGIITNKIKRYAVSTSPIGESGRIEVTVSTNCKDPFTKP